MMYVVTTLRLRGEERLQCKEEDTINNVGKEEKIYLEENLHFELQGLGIYST